MSDADASSEGATPSSDDGVASAEDGVAGGERGPTGGEASTVTDARRRLDAIRADADRRRTAQASGAVAGLVLAAVHPVGLVVGGALVGLFAADLRRAVGAGAAFGVLALVAFAATLAVGGGLGGYLAMGMLTAVSVGAGLVLPVLGSLVRGAV